MADLEKLFLRHATLLERVLVGRGFLVQRDPGSMAVGFWRGGRHVVVEPADDPHMFLAAVGSDEIPIMYIMGRREGEEPRRFLANGVLAAIDRMIFWGVLGEHELTPHDFRAAGARGSPVYCCGCRRIGPTTTGVPRFKQCAHCHARDRQLQAREHHGYYCSAVCQASDWHCHRRRHHADLSG
jgi:hypothetical protein